MTSKNTAKTNPFYSFALWLARISERNSITTQMRGLEARADSQSAARRAVAVRYYL